MYNMKQKNGLVDIPTLNKFTMLKILNNIIIIM